VRKHGQPLLAACGAFVRESLASVPVELIIIWLSRFHALPLGGGY
jgi:hypothetical protein